MPEYIKHMILGAIVGLAWFAPLQAYVLPVSYACKESFVRQTVNNPVWAKSFWEEVSKEYKQKHNLEGQNYE